MKALYKKKLDLQDAASDISESFFSVNSVRTPITTVSTAIQTNEVFVHIPNIVETRSAGTNIYKRDLQTSAKSCQTDGATEVEMVVSIEKKIVDWSDTMITEDTTILIIEHETVVDEKKILGNEAYRRRYFETHIAIMNRQ